MEYRADLSVSVRAAQGDAAPKQAVELRNRWRERFKEAPVFVQHFDRDTTAGLVRTALATTQRVTLRAGDKFFGAARSLGLRAPDVERMHALGRLHWQRTARHKAWRLPGAFYLMRSPDHW